MLKIKIFIFQEVTRERVYGNVKNSIRSKSTQKKLLTNEKPSK